ncbi:MotA/TolQ/ExbB proton channel family protein [Methylobacterium sp. J-072]|uniref:MotA/TolQ/ExbB proton channel family protein n=1 Tax=Methylobacterium sp. J-072 TaxID=2836651 RepID=UPI001FBAFE68|nr:MotA/TolQ/ExbB proton channel family protein [Methylobacterium sp. J-072]MCJ2094540.1 MotA/TolQ/ExbB proton channel family protein [Methylobacterium sp. J-072]
MDPASLSPSAMFFQAGLVGKGVIITLSIASVWCWALIAEDIYTTMRLGRSLKALERGGVPKFLRPVIDAGTQAAAVSLPNEGAGEARQRTVEAMNRAATHTMIATEGGYSNLAVIASVSPFVGLLGTVWGIMTSFISIAASNDTSLAVVAPGIAEALATTAIGLIAAIPAAIAYSRLGSILGKLSQNLAHLVEALSVDLIAKNRLAHKEI